MGSYDVFTHTVQGCFTSIPSANEVIAKDMCNVNDNEKGCSDNSVHDS